MTRTFTIAATRAPAGAHRDTFASNALHAGVTVFELARVMGTSVRMIERHYGALVDGAHAAITGRLDALEAGSRPSARTSLSRRVERE